MVWSLKELGWQSSFAQQAGEFEQQSDSDTESALIPARVSGHFGGKIEFLTEAGQISVPTSIVETDKAEDNGTSIAVGDWFLLAPNTHRAVFHLDRKTMLMRRAAGEESKPQLIAANIDTVFIVSSCNQDFSLSRIERYLAVVLESGATPVVVLTKADECEDPASYRQQAEKIQSGLIVETMDARSESAFHSLECWCESGQTIALVGSSGVGKSTLTNTLAGLDLATAPVREDDDKGRHTTTHRSMHRLKTGGWLIDSPGMREFQLPACEEGLAELFDDILELAQTCRFRNCDHQLEPGCAIQEAIQNGELEERRFINFRKLESEQRRNSESLAKRREKDRRMGKLYKSIISDKQKRRS